MTERGRELLPRQRESFAWWVKVAVVSLLMVVIVAAGGVALGRQLGDALGLGIVFTLPPILISVTHARRQRRDLERQVVGQLTPDRQEAALRAYAGRAQTDDPAVAHDAAGLILTVNGNVIGSSQVMGIVAISSGVGLAVLAAISSVWWAVDAVALVALGMLMIRQTQRLRARLRGLQAVAARSRS